MSCEGEPTADFGPFEAQFADVTRLQEVRGEALSLVQSVWSRVREPNETLPTSRRFIIAGAPNGWVPASHERVAMIPKPRGQRVGSIDKLRVAVPFLPGPEGAERRLDPRFAFVELARSTGGSTRLFLSHGECALYETSEEIRQIETDGDILYSVASGGERPPTLASAVMSFGDIDHGFGEGVRHSEELLALQELCGMLRTYDPDLQDNLPFGHGITNAG